MQEARTIRGPTRARTWRVAQPPDRIVSALFSELSCLDLRKHGRGPDRETVVMLARLLANRGVTGPDELRFFLRREAPGPEDPFLLKDMDRAVVRIKSAVDSGEPICVHGDYDADGLTATALLVTALGELGARVTAHIPNRSEHGYGLRAETLERLQATGTGLVVTVDCGITAVDEARVARSLGLGLVITDHHEPGPELPPAEAVVNPLRPGSLYPCRDLTGAGVAFKLVQALAEIRQPGAARSRSAATLFPEGAPRGEGWETLVDLVALGTVADVAPLLGENRRFVHAGLDLLNPPARPGFRALWHAAGLAGRRVTSYHLAFQLGPRLNAAGRLGDAEPALRLLLTRDADEAERLAAGLDQANRERQALVEDIFAAAAARAAEELDLETERAIVLAGEGWHEGVIGIVAARLVDTFHRPVVLLAMNTEGGRGSGRSIPSFDLVGALRACAARVGPFRFGGHRMAAGLELPPAAVARFRDEFLRLARERLDVEDLTPELRIDACVDPDFLAACGLDLAGYLEALEPHGPGNPEPVLALRGGEFVSARRVGAEGRHLRAAIRAGSHVFEAVGFGLGELAAGLGRESRNGARFDVAFRPALDDWTGRPRFELRLVDVRKAGGETAEAALGEAAGGR
ncbi:MAG: single-stranded-DNA-specific exonuclease RecJ [Bacillota bacterium]